MSPGPYFSPSISILLCEEDTVRVLVGRIDLGLRGTFCAENERRVDFNLLAASFFRKEGSRIFPEGVLVSSDMHKLLVYDSAELVSFSVRPSNLLLPLTPSRLALSLPSGLSGDGGSLHSDGGGDDDGTLHVSALIECYHVSSDRDALQCNYPDRTWWLCKSIPGVTRTSSSESKEEDGLGDNLALLGGATSDTICELSHDSLVGLVPIRVVRCGDRRMCAVVFQTEAQLVDSNFVVHSETKIALVEYSDRPLLTVIEGRDLSFLPSKDGDAPCFLLLSADGTSVSYVSVSRSLQCTTGASYRPIVGVDSTEVSEYIDSRQVVCFPTSGTKLTIAVIGKRLRDEKDCIVIGKMCDVESDVSSAEWSKLLPNIVSGPVAILNPNESVCSMVGLEPDADGYRNFGLSTSRRVLILSSSMGLVAEASRGPSLCDAIAPIGSFVVCYVKGDSIGYLCCLDKGVADGCVTTLPKQCHFGRTFCLLGLFRDRLVLLDEHSCIQYRGADHKKGAFRLPIATTSPALLLEPMVANAICVGGGQDRSTPLLRSVVEQFGRKSASFAHDDGEGIGNLGAGITSKTFELLNRYGLHEANSWLLTGSVNFGRSANSNVLPPFVPIGPKVNPSFPCDTFLHLVTSGGDSYLLDYVRNPRDNPLAILPKASGCASFLCREYASRALRTRRAADAITTLDLSGSAASESLAFQLGMHCGKEEHGSNLELLQTMGGNVADGSSSRSEENKRTVSVLATISVGDKPFSTTDKASALTERKLNSLALSLQRKSRMGRTRQRLLGEENASIPSHHSSLSDPEELWRLPCSEMRHVWYVFLRLLFSRAKLISLMSS